MIRLGFMILLLAALGCGGSNKTKPEDETSFDYESFSKHYTAAALPYLLNDTDLLKTKDTAHINSDQITPFVSDSIKRKIFGKAADIRYVPLDKIENKKGESYFITKAISGTKQAALLTVFGKDRQAAVSFPFLIPDAASNTTQNSTIDKAYSISRNVTQREKNDILIEGKDVYAFNAAINNFTLIMTDVLNEEKQELVNPIDTLQRQHKYAADYGKGKNNIVSIRDGRNPNELAMFIHFEAAEEGEEPCIGELKGTLFLTSTTTAVYRQGGDPCVLEFKFTPTSVTLKEDEGCGSHRGLKCTFDGTYPRKGLTKPKAAKKKSSKK